MVTFNCRVTKNGNLKLAKRAREILGLTEGDKVQISLYNGDEIHIPQEFLDEAGISENSPLEVYAENGRVVVQEVCDD